MDADRPREGRPRLQFAIEHPDGVAASRVDRRGPDATPRTSRTSSSRKQGSPSTIGGRADVRRLEHPQGHPVRPARRRAADRPPVRPASKEEQMSVTVIVPTYNEAPNVEELVRRVNDATAGLDAEILFVDDSTDETPDVIERVCRTQRRAGPHDPPRRTGRRAERRGRGGHRRLADRMVSRDGRRPPASARDDPCPPQTGSRRPAPTSWSPRRHIGGGSNAGLSGWARKAVSNGVASPSPVRCSRRVSRNCTDPMTGFFALRRDAVDVATLRPQGFKILLEILARHRLRVVEEPFIFGKRHAGESKADLRQGIRFFAQLASLRFGRMSRFAVIGAIGAVLNLLIMAGLGRLDGTTSSPCGRRRGRRSSGTSCFRSVSCSRDLRHEGRGFWQRFAQSFSFNSADAAIRLPSCT